MLDGVGEFMGKQRPAMMRRRFVAVFTEDDVLPDRISWRANELRRSCRRFVGVDADLRKIGVKPRLQRSADGSRERLPWSGEYLVHARPNCGRLGTLTLGSRGQKQRELAGIL